MQESHRSGTQSSREKFSINNMKKYSILLVIIAIGIFFAVVDPKYKEIKVLNNTKAENDVMLEKAKLFSEKKANNRYRQLHL